MRRSRFWHFRPTFRQLLLVAGALLVVLAVGLLLRSGAAALSLSRLRVALAQLGPWGPVTLIAALASVLVVPVIPATVLQIGAGLAFGPSLGLVYVLVADLLGAAIGFGLARWWMERLLQRFFRRSTGGKILSLARRMNWRTVMLLRLLPGPAYPLVSFAAGLSSLGTWSYLLASFAGVLPSLALLVLAGDLVTRSPMLAFALVAVLVGSLALLGRLIDNSGGAPAPQDSPDKG